MEFDIRLAANRLQDAVPQMDKRMHQVNPGDVVSHESGYMRGHGTYFDDADDSRILASVAGRVERVNKLIYVRPLKTRYVGEVGDVVIGRITEVGNKRWKVDAHAMLDSALMLSCVNLPGGELRKRSEEDERMMREYLSEGDLISAEVQSIFSDGQLSLHTRSLKYGKLGQGILVKVSPSLIKRCKNHFHNLPCGATVILGNNGYIWICPLQTSESAEGGFIQQLDPVSEQNREVIVRMKNSILCLAHYKMMLYDTSIYYAYEASSQYQLYEMVKPEAKRDIVSLTRQRLDSEM
ncbi:exosome complex component RRP4-like [Watersipora subatra]|uniref:exosome complex component RRP4-like n=1 Tax=Watersipora subatra TaxID=2589382 RepID=UPI00355BE9EC